MSFPGPKEFVLGGQAVTQGGSLRRVEQGAGSEGFHVG
jgi:hypothetical protein